MLNKSLNEIKGIGPNRAKALNAQGLFSLHDILYFYPTKYKDFSSAKQIDELYCSMEAAVRVRAVSVPKVSYIRRNMNTVRVKVEDSVGRTMEVVWFNQSYRANQIPSGGYFYLLGRVDAKKSNKMVNPSICNELPGIVTAYKPIKGITNKLLSELVKEAFKCSLENEEILPTEILKKYSLISKAEALNIMHFPKSTDELKKAKKRLAFEDVMLFRTMLHLAQGSIRGEREKAFVTDGLKEEFKSKLSFTLTSAQERVMDEINLDLSKKTVMNRLVQGDVGSGKTAVAFYCMYAAIKNGAQAALMAPTEILAQQHFVRLKEFFSEDEAVLLTGSMKKKERDEAFEKIRSGKAKAIVGTHALLFKNAEFNNLGMVIVDEQHRFGVRQRAKLQNKGNSPHMLVMSATPIPRTLALILYGDLDISVIDELPKGRKRVITKTVKEHKREDMYAFIDKRAENGQQAFVVCPLIEYSEALENVMSATQMYEELSEMLNCRVALLTGQTDNIKKQEITQAFANGEIDVLVSTTVIEVGVDVPNASVMVIESADRFGLSQLHQLRGRVGRGNEQSYCFLLSESQSKNATERLDMLSQTSDGFKIAEYDLENRGPGEFLGVHQHGMDEFSSMQLALDIGVLNDASKAANEIVSKGYNEEYKKLFAKAYEKLEKKSDIAMN